MRLKFSPTVFMLAYCIVYVACLTKDLPAFRYYPLHGQINWGPGKVQGLGPAMAWYGIMLNAAVAALVLAFVPDGWLAKLLRNRHWIVGVVAMGACVYLMKKFFV